MRFNPLREMPVRESDAVYRASKTGPVIALAIMAAIFAVVHWFPQPLPPMPLATNWFVRGWKLEAYLILGVCVLGFSDAAVDVHGRQSWLLRQGDAGLAINLRSYNARRLSEDLVIVRLDREEVASVRAVHVKMPRRRVGIEPENAPQAGRLNGAAHHSSRLRSDRPRFHRRHFGRPGS